MKYSMAIPVTKQKGTSFTRTGLMANGADLGGIVDFRKSTVSLYFAT